MYTYLLCTCTSKCAMKYNCTRYMYMWRGILTWSHLTDSVLLHCPSPECSVTPCECYIALCECYITASPHLWVLCLPFPVSALLALLCECSHAPCECCITPCECSVIPCECSITPVSALLPSVSALIPCECSYPLWVHYCPLWVLLPLVSAILLLWVLY